MGIKIYFIHPKHKEEKVYFMPTTKEEIFNPWISLICFSINFLINILDLESQERST